MKRLFKAESGAQTGPTFFIPLRKREQVMKYRFTKTY